jgi:hypothetical protein
MKSSELRYKGDWPKNPFLIYLASFMALSLVTRILYGYFAPGVPDSGMVPNSLLPWLFPYYLQDGFYVLGPVLFFIEGSWLVWVSACSIYLVPPILGFWLSKRWTHFGFLGALLIGQTLLAGIDDWSTRDAFFFEHPYSTKAAIRLLARPFGWVVCLLLIGVLLGIALRRRAQTREVVRSVCTPAEGPDVL